MTYGFPPMTAVPLACAILRHGEDGPKQFNQIAILFGSASSDTDIKVAAQSGVANLLPTQQLPFASKRYVYEMSIFTT